MNPGHDPTAEPRLRSSVEGVAWPPVLLGQAATLEALQAQFRETERWPPERLAATGFGEYRPVNPDNTPEARAQNRRVVIKVLA